MNKVMVYSNAYSITTQLSKCNSFSHIFFLKLILQYTLPIKSSHIPEFCRHIASEGWGEGRGGGAHLTFLLFLAADLFLNIHLRIKLPWIPFFPFLAGSDTLKRNEKN